MTTVELLSKAKTRIGDPDHWTACRFAVDVTDICVAPDSASASKWCALGALMAETTGYTLLDYGFDVLNRAAMSLYGITITLANDHLDHASLLAVFDKAIEQESTMATPIALLNLQERAIA